MYQQYKDVADFLMVYIREAHPEDERQAVTNVKEGVIYKQPKTNEERLRIAAVFRQKNGLRMPLMVDPIDDEASKAFAAMPERMYVIDPSGKIVLKGGMGPFDFDPNEVRPFLEAERLKSAAQTTTH